jgi:MAE_28990/MAE_18760-like HEPN
MTFQDLVAQFDDRVAEVDVFFNVLSAVDNDELRVVDGVADNFLTKGKPPDSFGPMLKGTANLILYNLVEAFVSKGFEAVFDAIVADRACGVDLNATLRDQWIAQRHRKVTTVDGCPRIYMEVAGTIVDEICGNFVARLHKDHLPFPGTLNADRIRKLFHLHGIELRVDPATKGGEALNPVMKRRNSLAHGDESFAECGRQLTAADLMQAKQEVVLFMRGLIGSLETFATTGRFRSISA